jgi:DMSO/TMAO reductase YedYZ molybdopterin-dependent catalytic subunit
VFSFADILQLERVDQITDFHCVEGWSVLDVPWSGVRLSTLLDQARPLQIATHVTFHCFGDVYEESLPVAEALEPKTLLAYGINCSTLPLQHGFPLRLVIPRKWGYKNAKYVHRIELADEPVFGLWEHLGGTYEADVRPEKLREGKY